MKKHYPPTFAFWQKQSPDVQGMMLNSNAVEFEHVERDEVLGYLPGWKSQHVVELAAGIGRFTGHFAAHAARVTAVDFMGSFLEENHKAHKHHGNIQYICSDAMEVEFQPADVDFVFINWLMMYLEDAQVEVLIDRIYSWLRPGGFFFFRESCISPSNPKAHHPHSHYRQPALYLDCLQGRFEIVAEGNVKIYEEKYGNPNQLWWLCRKHG